MFLHDILKNDEYKLLIDKYSLDYLETIDYENFMIIYKYLRSKKIYYIDDLIINYLDIFTLELDLVKKVLKSLEDEFGPDYIFVVGDNLELFEDTIINILER